MMMLMMMMAVRAVRARVRTASVLQYNYGSHSLDAGNCKFCERLVDLRAEYGCFRQRDFNKNVNYARDMCCLLLLFRSCVTQRGFRV